MGGGGGKSTDTSTQEADLARQRAEVDQLEAEADAKSRGIKKASEVIGGLSLIGGVAKNLVKFNPVGLATTIGGHYIGKAARSMVFDKKE